MALTVKVCNKIKQKDTTKAGSAIQPGTFFMGQFSPDHGQEESLFVKVDSKIYPVDVKQDGKIKILFGGSHYWSAASTVYNYTPVDVLITASPRKGKPKKKAVVEEAQEVLTADNVEAVEKELVEI